MKSGDSGGRKDTKPSDAGRVNRFIRRLERVSSPAVEAHSRLFRRLMELRGRYLFAVSEDNGADISGLIRLYREAHAASGTEAGDAPGRKKKAFDGFIGRLRDVNTGVRAFNDISVEQWKKKARAAAAVKVPLERVRRSIKTLSVFPEFGQLDPVIDGWLTDASATHGFYLKMGGLFEGREEGSINSLDLTGLDRDGRATGDPAFERQLEQFEQLKIDLLLREGDDPALSYARILLLESGGTWSVNGEDGRAGDGRGRKGPVDIISGAFRSMLFTMLALAYMPLLIMGVMGTLGARSSDADLMEGLAIAQLLLGFFVPLLFILWTLSGTGFDGKGLRLFNTRLAVITVALALIMVLVGPLWQMLAGMTGAAGGLFIIICAAAGLGVLLLRSGAASSRFRGRTSLVRYGMVHMVTLPLAVVAGLLAGSLHLGTPGDDAAVLGVPLQLEADIAGIGMNTAPGLAMMFSFLLAAAGIIIYAASLAGSRR